MSMQKLQFFWKRMFKQGVDRLDENNETYNEKLLLVEKRRSKTNEIL